MMRSGIEIVSRDNHDAAAELERALAGDFVEQCPGITAYEMKWPHQQYAARHGALIEQRVHDRMAQAQAMKPADYTARLATRTAMCKKARTLMRVDGLPLGLQLIGAAGKDGTLCAHAHWLMRQSGA